MLSVIAILPIIYLVIASHANPASDPRLRVVPLIAGKNEGSNKDTAATTTKPAAYPITATTAFHEIYSSDTSTPTSTKSRQICEERISGMLLSLCHGCFIQESSSPDESGQKMRHEDQQGNVVAIPWAKLNETGMRCCKETCSLVDFMKLCCDVMAINIA